MTFKEISNYPPGTVYNKIDKTYERKGYWYTDADKAIIKLEHPNAIINLDNTYDYIEHYSFKEVVDAWLFDGKEWYCAQSTWDGYDIIEDEELKKGNML